jgi:SAM-dependent methyltransferase
LVTQEAARTLGILRTSDKALVCTLNINTKQYWDQRFGTGDWESKGGFQQTEGFARSQIRHLELPATFDGTLCDFGCGAGDAFPIYRQQFPVAKLVGVDVSQHAIELCQQRFGHLADFVCGDCAAVPQVDVIIASNVLEHLDNDQAIAAQLLERCKTLYIVVPFRETLTQGSEHVNRYDLDSFSDLPCTRRHVFVSEGWGHHGWHATYHVDLKNVARRMLGRPVLERDQRQIMYTFERTR